MEQEVVISRSSDVQSAVAELCSKYNIEVQSWLKLATEVMNTKEMQVA